MLIKLELFFLIILIHFKHSSFSLNMQLKNLLHAILIKIQFLYLITRLKNINLNYYLKILLKIFPFLSNF